jgi:periplasmic protein TonB
MGHLAMSADNINPVIELPLLAGDRWSLPRRALDREFWIAVTFAAALHALLLIGVFRSAPHRLGEAEGQDNGISISVVTEADLQSRSTVPVDVEPPPGAPAATAPLAPPPKPPETPVAETPPEAPPPQTEPATEPATEPKTEKAPDIKPSLADDAPNATATREPVTPSSKEKPNDKPVEKPNQAKPQSPAKASDTPPQKQRTAKLDLSLPPSALNAPVGGHGRFSGASRPAGITRSGANDDFGRAVIRELWKTFPYLKDHGSVLLRIILNQNGNVADVTVLQSSQVASLDQGVIFAIKQTSFPFPIPNAAEADRTFFVKYIYD